MSPHRRHLVWTLLTSPVALISPAAAQRSDSAAGKNGERLPRFTPADFGAKGDGTSDDTAACNAAAAAASKSGGEIVFPAGRVFAISSSIIIRSGVRRVTGEGGLIRCINRELPAGLLLAGGFRPGESNVDGCTVQGMRIDCGFVESADTIGIFGQNISNCQILDNHIFNLKRGYGVLLRSFFEGRTPTYGNFIERNRIEADTEGAHTCWGIGMDAMLNFREPFKTTLSQWKGSFTVPDTSVPVVNNLVRGNDVIGGYYGLAMYSGRDNTIVSNRFSRNVRSISLQTSCLSNVVSRNECVDSSSSAIHLAYGSSRNRVIDNLVRSTRAAGEGLLQSYVGASDNLFQGNETNATGLASPKYHLYAGAHADGNRFIGNRLNGRCSRAYIGIESAFYSKFDAPSHRAYRGGPEYDYFAQRGMSGIRIEGNRIKADSGVAVISLVQVSDDRGSYPLTDVAIRSNSIAAPIATPLLVIAQAASGGVSRIVLEDNQFPNGARPADFVLPEGDRHFASLMGNAGADFLPQSRAVKK